MSCRSQTLYWLLWDMGLQRAQCHHIVKTFDRLRLCNMGSADWNKLLRQGADMQTLKATSTLRYQISRLLGIGIEKGVVFNTPTLFDDDLRTDG